ncbi:prolyl oligopeptidase family serine peptidase [Myroides pelagicus]|uniref:alpha/beta hydrolase family protein n=1 Tax=Myroides pelagicus TaxID=270914 RepID=UPI002DB7437D|nr:prolyl oligopeptidase family serine peptidase [Myroides pelagicus]MEC4115094.1 prolyl oligopeptidase family serine peptidase [Myroides pelagicus]
MKTRRLISLILIINILSLVETYSQTKTSDFFNDPTWNSNEPLGLSPDGEWAVIGKRYNKNPKVNKLYFINTKNNKKKDLTHFSGFHESLLNKGLVVGRVNDNLAIYSLNQNDSLFLKNIKKFNTNQDFSFLFHLDENNEFVITKLNEILSKNKTVLSLQNIERYYLSPDSNSIIVLNKSKDIIHIDLKKLKPFKILKINDQITNFKWNIKQDGFVIKSNNALNIVNLNDHTFKRVELRETNATMYNFQVSFFLNNDVYFSYETITNDTITENEFVDIWKGNSKLLLPSDFKHKYKKSYKSFIYHNKNEKITELNRDINREYLNIGIPGYLLSYNYFKDIDFNNAFHSVEYSLYDINKKKDIMIVSSVTQNPFKPSIDGKHILYPINNTRSKWEILNVNTLEKHSFNVDVMPPTNKSGYTTTVPFWSQDSKTILFPFKSNFYSYNLKRRKTTKITHLKKNNERSVGKIINPIIIPSYTSYINKSTPFYFTVFQHPETTIYVHKNQKTIPIYSTKKQLSINNKISNDLETILFSIEDYNLPPQILSFQNNEVKTLLESDIQKDLYSWRKRVDYTFLDKHNKKLNAYLYYPKNFDPKKNYPMIVQIYDLGLHSPHNEFAIPVHVATDSGFNSAILTENEFFVLRAQTYVSDEGPGVGAVDCVTAAVEKAVEIEATIDIDNLGLIGHSFGGYKTSAVSVLSNLFKASVSGAGAHDMIASMFRYSYYRKMPDWFMVENSQTNMNVKFSEDPTKYYRNSPILNAHKTQTAMLLFTGLQDENVAWENTRKMFIALKREQKPVVALFYKNINHGFNSLKPTESNDLSERVLDWFNYHLKDKKHIPWIQSSLDYNKYSLSPF